MTFCLGASSAVVPPSPPQAAAKLHSGAPAALYVWEITNKSHKQLATANKP